VSADTFPAVRACALAVLSGAVLQMSGVTAGRGKVIDWREVKSGETIQEDADAFDTAQLFVALVGPEAALAVATKYAGNPPPAPAITAYRPNEHGQRVREFTTPAGFKVTVRSADYGEDDEAEAAELTTRLAGFVVENA
jgi:hypothetical protein